MRYIGAISDTDILINLAKVNRLDVLDYLFKKNNYSSICI
jgi:predicted nucleic acid-binding protein